MADPSTPEEWFALADQHEASALAMVGHKFAAGQAQFHAGLAVECALKAFIMRRERLVGWPSRDRRPELHVDDLRRLREIAGITVGSRDPQAPGLASVFAKGSKPGLRSATDAAPGCPGLDRGGFRSSRTGDMDTQELPLGLLQEGQCYLEAVEALGLHPAALFWAYDHAAAMFVLVLITEEYDHVGPLELSTFLFKAHNAAVTPGSISPLMIRMHSPNHQIVRELYNRVAKQAGLFRAGSDGPSATSGRVTVEGLEIHDAWIYRSRRPLPAPKAVDVVRRWHQVQRNVDEAA